MTTPNSDTESLSDRELLERIAKQLDHVDLMVHGVSRFIDDHRPALAKGLAMLDSPAAKAMAKVRAML